MLEASKEMAPMLKLSLVNLNSAFQLYEKSLIFQEQC